jgi:hypothetical protein
VSLGRKQMARFQRIHKDSTMNRAVALLFFLLTFAQSSPESSAQIYKYVDKDGAVHFTNTPTDAGYKSYMGAEPEKKEALEARSPAKSSKTPSQEKNDLDDLDDLDNLGDLEDFDELPPLPPLP